MSHTSLYEVYKTKMVKFKELNNGHGSGPPIWDYISLKYANRKFSLAYEDHGWFWPLWKDPRLDRNEKAVLLSTYDQAVIGIDYLFEFSKACKEVHQKIIDGTKWTWNHFSDIGKGSLDLSIKHDFRCRGMAIGCTSVWDEWESWKPRDKEPWCVYSSIESL